jgi:hypothetical protein
VTSWEPPKTKLPGRDRYTDTSSMYPPPWRSRPDGHELPADYEIPFGQRADDDDVEPPEAYPGRITRTPKVVPVQPSDWTGTERKRASDEVARQQLAAADEAERDATELADLRARLAHLEHLVEGT